MKKIVLHILTTRFFFFCKNSTSTLNLYNNIYQNRTKPAMHFKWWLSRFNSMCPFYINTLNNFYRPWLLWLIDGDNFKICMIINLGHENQDIRSIYCMRTAYIVLTTNNLLFKDTNILVKIRPHQEEKRMFKLKCTCVCVPNIKLE